MELSEDETQVLNAVARLEGEFGKIATRLAIRRLVLPPPNPGWEGLFTAAESTVAKGALRRFSTHDDIAYKLTVEGWLQCEKFPQVKELIRGFIQAFRTKYEGDFAGNEVTWKELVDAGVSSQVNLAISAGATLHLWANGATGGPESTFGRPFDLDMVLSCETPEAFIDYRLKNPAARVAYRNELERHATGEARRAVSLVYKALVENRRWPLTRRINVTFRREKLDLTRTADHGRFLRGADLTTDDAVTGVTLEGLVFVPDAADDRRDIVRLLAFLGEHYETRPELREVEPQLLMASLGLDEEDLSHLATILANQWSTFVSMNGRAFSIDASRFYVGPDHLDFVGAESFEDIVYAIHDRRIDVARQPGQAPLPIVPSMAHEPIVAPSPKPTTRASATFGPWKKIGGLKGGAQGEVSVVERHEPEYTKGVLKRVRANRDHDPKAAKRLLREALALRKLRHPCIAELVGVSLPNAPEPWLVTRWAPFGSIDRHLSVYKGDVWRTLRLARDLAGALEAAHLSGIIHRDVKPKNILMYSLDHIALTDFGISHHDEEETLTSTDEAPGTYWFGPADRQERRDPKPSLDVFNLGRLVYFMLSDGRQFKHTHRDKDDDLGTLLQRGDLELVNQLLDQMINLDRSRRPQSMRAVIVLIDRALDQLFGGRTRAANVCRACSSGTYVDAGALTFTPPTELFLEPGQLKIRLGEFKPRAWVCSSCGDLTIRFEQLMGLAKR